MRFFPGALHDPKATPEEIKDVFETYYRHIESLRDRMPAKAYEFASARWHYDDGTKGLHDSWVQSVVVREVADGECTEIRRVEIDVELLGAYHDRTIRLHYTGVREYEFMKDPSDYGHGDWLTDEFDVSDDGFVVHDIELNGGTWRIVCQDVEFSERTL